MAVKIKKGSALADLNLTPMIDVVFELLIFFLVATRFEEAEREMSVRLPEASEAQPLTSVPKETFVNVDQQGKFFVNGEIKTSQGLFAVLQQKSAQAPGRARVIIRADKQAAFQYVVVVMDLCNKAGIRDYDVSIAGGDSG